MTSKSTMFHPIKLAAFAVAALGLVSCGPKPADSTAAAPGEAAQASPAPTGLPPGVAAPLRRDSDGSQDIDVNKYAEQLQHDPALYEKQKAICHNAGPEANPSSLGAVCSAFNTARMALDLERNNRENPVTNTGSL